MKDLFYDQSGLVIAAVLLALMAISIEAGRTVYIARCSPW